MATHTVTPETGATLKPGPMLVVVPDLLVEDAQLADFAADSGLNGPFLADVLSVGVTHQRCGMNLLRMLAANSDNPLTKPQVAAMRGQQEASIDAYEALITQLGGNPQYASPAARMTEILDSKIVEAFSLSGSADPLTRELKSVEAILLAATCSVANVDLLQALSDDADEGQSKTALTTAVGALAGPAAEQAEWARTTMLKLSTTQAKHPVVQKVAQAAESAIGAVKNALHQ
jgi:hypothetical protein